MVGIVNAGNNSMLSKRGGGGGGGGCRKFFQKLKKDMVRKPLTSSTRKRSDTIQISDQKPIMNDSTFKNHTRMKFAPIIDSDFNKSTTSRKTTTDKRAVRFKENVSFALLSENQLSPSNYSSTNVKKPESRMKLAPNFNKSTTDGKTTSILSNEKQRTNQDSILSMNPVSKKRKLEENVHLGVHAKKVVVTNEKKSNSNTTQFNSVLKSTTTTNTVPLTVSEAIMNAKEKRTKSINEERAAARAKLGAIEKTVLFDDNLQVMRDFWKLTGSNGDGAVLGYCSIYH
ncbi:hypothetical protein ACFE04_013722 [Oxalis oulophora]